jgi:hypothetical protein
VQRGNRDDAVLVQNGTEKGIASTFREPLIHVRQKFRVIGE